MKAQYTPGPWELSYDQGSTRDVIATKGSTPICTARQAWVTREEYAANAALIAAAPELLAQLQALVDACPECNGKGTMPTHRDPITEAEEYGPCPWCEAARLAIAKAGGMG